jgi:hypothetical protein
MQGQILAITFIFSVIYIFLGKEEVNQWKIRAKNTPRLQLQQKKRSQTAMIASPSHTDSAYQLQQANAFNTHNISGNQQLLKLNPQSVPSTSTSQLPLLSSTGNLSSLPHNLGYTTCLKTQEPIQQSTSHILYPVLQSKPCMEHYQSSTQQQQEVIPPNPSLPQLKIPCTVSAAQTKTNHLKSYYNFSSSNLQSETISNKPYPHQCQQYHQLHKQQQQQQQYSAARHQQTSLSLSQEKQQQSSYQTAPHQSQLVSQSPTCEKFRSPVAQSYDPSDNQLCKTIIHKTAVCAETTKFSAKTNTSQYQKGEDSKQSTSSTILHHQLDNNNMNTDNNQTTQQNPNVICTSGINSSSPKGVDFTTSVQSTWMVTKPPGNVHLMGLSAGSALKKLDLTHNAQNTELSPTPIARSSNIISPSSNSGNAEPPTTKQKSLKNSHFHSDSSTSFDFSIEAEKMVSDLCNSTPMKELETSYAVNTAYSNGNFNNAGSQLLVRSRSEGCLATKEKLKLSECNELNLSKISLLATQENKHWTMSSAESTDEADSIYSACTVEINNLQSLTESEGETNVNDSLLRLSPSSNSSVNITRNTKFKRQGNVYFEENSSLRDREVTVPQRGQPKQSKNLTRKLRNASFQTDIFEGVYDEQFMFCTTTLKGCNEITKIIEECMSPSLEGLHQFCTEVQEAISKPKTLVNESIQKDLIAGFLRLATCWENLYPCLGMSQYKLNNLGSVGVEVIHLFKNWTCASQKLMEVLIKVFQHQLNENHGNTMNKEVNTAQVNTDESIGFSNQGFISNNEYPFSVTQGGNPNNFPQITSLTGMQGINPAARNSPSVFPSVPQNTIFSYPDASMYMRSHIINPVHIRNNLANKNTNHKPNWKLRQFTDTKLENSRSQNHTRMHKGKGSLPFSKNNNRMWNVASLGKAESFHSTYKNPKYSETSYDNTIIPNYDCIPSSRASQSKSQVTQDRFNHHHHIDNRFKKKMNALGKRSSQRLLNSEAHLRDRALDTLEFSKDFQQQEAEVSQINQKSPGHQAYVGKTLMDEVTSVPESKVTSLSQIGACSVTHCPSQHVDLSSWFQNSGGCLPMSVYSSQLTSIQNSPEVFDRRSQPDTIIEPILHPNQDISGPSTIITSQQSERQHSYQDRRNQLITGRYKRWSNKGDSSYINKPAVTYPAISHTEILTSHQCDEHDSSDDLQDRVYMKPGSYDVPKKQHALINNGERAPLIINNNVSNPLQSPPTMVTPFIGVPPSSCSMEISPESRIRCINKSKPQESLAVSIPSVNKSNNLSDTSDIAWKAACASAETLRETLKGSSRSPKSSNVGNLDTQDQTMTDKECGEKTGNESIDNIVKSKSEANGKDKEKQCKKSKSIAERIKCNTVKTDDWLISTLNNVSKSQSATERKCKGAGQGMFTSTCAELPTSGINTSNVTERAINTENHKRIQLPSDPDGQKSADSKNVTSKQKQDGKKDEVQLTQTSTKSVNGTSGKKAHCQHQESGRSNSDSRKRKLQERSPNEEQEAMQTKNEGSIKACASVCEQSQATLSLNKPKPKHKNDIRNKATWNIWYSSRHQRGLSTISVNKLQDILNVVWNMKESDFVKYPVSSSEVRIQTYEHFLF